MNGVWSALSNYGNRRNLASQQQRLLLARTCANQKWEIIVGGGNSLFNQIEFIKLAGNSNNHNCRDMMKSNREKETPGVARKGWFSQSVDKVVQKRLKSGVNWQLISVTKEMYSSFRCTRSVRPVNLKCSRCR
jgi:hypothetical protein